MTRRATRSLEPLPDIKHGMPGYKLGCGCKVCRAANASKSARRRKDQYLGRQRVTQLVEIGRAETWVRFLKSQGMGNVTIAAAAGLSVSIIDRISTGRCYVNDAVQARITRATEAKVLAVSPGTQRAGARVDAKLTWQRVHGLVALGYQLGWIAQQIGLSQQDRLALGRSTVTVTTARAVAGLCERIGDTPGPSVRARRFAKKQGWLIPGNYDDDLRLLAA